MTKKDAQSFLVPEAIPPYCNGCGHHFINQALDQALINSGKTATQINLISDIGCVGLVDRLFSTNTIHTTHGRSTAFATGLNAADEILFEDDTLNIVMIGDGGATIGLLHLVEAAKFNMNITVILHNNFVYGMTGGQNSGLTPVDFNTATTRSGNFIPPVNMLELLKASGASFLARGLATDKNLNEIILEGFKHKGFSLIEVVELCTGYATKWNSMTKKDVSEILEKSNSEQLGIIHQSKSKKSFCENYKNHFPKQEQNKSNQEQKSIFDFDLKEFFTSNNLESLSIVLAGTAGHGVQYAAKNLALLACKQGFHIIQKNDNPTTVGVGFSLSELKISKNPILYLGIENPDYLLLSSQDGLKRAQTYLNTSKKIIADSALKDQVPKSTYYDLQDKQDFRKVNLNILSKIFTK